MDLHLPNATRPLTREEIDFIVGRRPRHIVLMIYGAGVVPEAFDQHMEIVSRTGARMILRPYEPAPIKTWNPLDWAHECAERLWRYTGMEPLVVLDNEPNHREDGGVTDAHKIHDFWVDTAVEFRRVLPIYHKPTLAMPPLSPIGNYRDIYRRLKNLGTHKWFKAAAAHVYARSMNWDEDRFLKNTFDLDTYVTEFDTWTENGYLNLAEALSWLPLAKTICWFIVNSDDPQFDFCNLMKHEEEIMSLTDRVESLEAKIDDLRDLLLGTPERMGLMKTLEDEKQRNAWLVEFMARHGLSDPEVNQYARTFADAASPGLLQSIQAELPKG